MECVQPRVPAFRWGSPHPRGEGGERLIVYMQINMMYTYNIRMSSYVAAPRRRGQRSCLVKANCTDNRGRCDCDIYGVYHKTFAAVDSSSSNCSK